MDFKLEILIPLILFIIIVYLLIFHNTNKNKNKNSYNRETFIDIGNKNIQCESSNIFTKSLESNFSDEYFRCLLDTNSMECKYDKNGELDLTNLYPIQIIIDKSKNYYALFNDGFIYQNDNIEQENLWRGPLPNSQPKEGVKLRMITFSQDDYLFGIGTDDKLYIKTTPDIESPFQINPIPNSGCLIYVMYDKDGILLGLDQNGMILKKENDDITSEWKMTNGTDEPLLKIFWDLNGHLIGLTTKFELVQKEIVDWQNSKWKKKRNTQKVIDVLYSNDGRLYGLAINPILKTVKLMKQNKAYYSNPFYLLVDNDPPGLDKLTNKEIYQTKVGVGFSSAYFNKDQSDNDIEDPTIEEVRQNYILETQKKLRQLCKRKKKAQQKGNYYDFELERKIEEQTNLINNMKREINQYMKLDKNMAKLQEEENYFTDINKILKKPDNL